MVKWHNGECVVMMLILGGEIDWICSKQNRQIPMSTVGAVPNEEFVEYELEILLDCLQNAKVSLKSVGLLPSELLARYIAFICERNLTKKAVIETSLSSYFCSSLQTNERV